MQNRFLFTGNHPNPIDTWALKQWNFNNLRAREEYEYTMSRMDRSKMMTPCERCGKTKTASVDGLCSVCRRIIESRVYNKCENCGGHCQRPNTKCFNCRQEELRIARLREWCQCKNRPCPRKTRHKSGFCYECRRGKKTNYRWARRKK